jgi:hypothetical protein
MENNNDNLMLTNPFQIKRNFKCGMFDYLFAKICFVMHGIAQERFAVE